MPGTLDNLLYFAGGIALGKLVKVGAEKYADPKASMNFPSLKAAGKPSVYIPLATGAVATGYVADKANKRGMLTDEDYLAAGYGFETVLDAVVDILQTASAGTTAMRVGGGTIRSVGSPVQGSRASGYPLAPNGSKQGMA